MAMTASETLAPGPSDAIADRNLTLRTFSAAQVKALTDEDFEQTIAHMFSDVDPDGIENLLEDPRAQSRASRKLTDPQSSSQDGPNAHIRSLEHLVKKGDVASALNFIRRVVADLQQTAQQIAIVQAIEHSSLDILRTLVSPHTVNTRYEGKTYLHEAVVQGQLEVVRFLIETGQADTKMLSPIEPLGQRLPIQVAAWYGDEKIFEYLLNLRPSYAQSVSDWRDLVFDLVTRTASPMAPLCDSKDEVEPLLPRQRQPQWNSKIVTTLCSSSFGCSNSIIDVNTPRSDGSTLLHVAGTDVHKLYALMKCGASPFARDKSGNMPFDAGTMWNTPVADSGSTEETLMDIFESNYQASFPKLEVVTFPDDLSGSRPSPGSAVVRWETISANCDAFFTSRIAKNLRKRHNQNFVASTLQMLCRTFVQHDAADRTIRFREPSYNVFTLSNEPPNHNLTDKINLDRSSITSIDTDEADWSQVQSRAEPREDTNQEIDTNAKDSSPKDQSSTSNTRVEGLSLVVSEFAQLRMKTDTKHIPYLHTAFKNAEIDRRTEMRDYVVDQRSDAALIVPVSTHEPSPKERIHAQKVQRLRLLNALNIHEPRTLDESYYPGFKNQQLMKRNCDQVLSSYLGKSDPNPRLLMVSQLWLWSMEDYIITSCGSSPRRGDAFEVPDSLQDPQSSLQQEFALNNLQSENIANRWQLTALLLSECINNLDRPNYAGLDETVFHAFESTVGKLYDDVKTYMDENNMGQIQIKKEMQFIHDISDVRDELSMIKNVINEQEEVWDRFYRDLKRVEKLDTWDSNHQRVALRPKYQIPKFKRRIQKIDEDAQRVEQWILGQLDLKKTHASLRESHNSTILSTAVIGFTIITIIFTPLSFMTSYLAVDDNKLGWGGKANSGRTWLTIVEIISLLVTAFLVAISIFILKRRQTLSDDTSDTHPSNPAPIAAPLPHVSSIILHKLTAMLRSKGSTDTLKSGADQFANKERKRARTFFGGLKHRSKTLPADPEQFAMTEFGK